MPKFNRSIKVAGVLAATTAAMVSSPVFAAGTDFSGITAGLDGSTIVTAGIAACSIIATVGFAIWGGKRLAGMFGKN